MQASSRGGWQIRGALAPALSAAALTWAALSADAAVFMREKSSSTGVNGVGTVDETSEIVIDGDRQRQDRRVKTSLDTTSGERTIEILRLDKELTWSLDPEAKTYTETTFQTMRELLKMTSQLGGPMGSDEAEVVVESPGAKKKINGILTEQRIIHVQGKPPADGQKSVFQGARTTVELWVAADAPGAQELDAFRTALAKKMGVKPGMLQAGGAVPVMGGALGKLADELTKLEGVPMLTIMTMEMEGPMGDLSLTARIEVLEIRTTDIPKVSFEIPAGYELTESQIPTFMH